jgi:hypothetical protein
VREPGTIEIKDLRSDQVAAVVACVIRCYRDHYPESEFYSADALAQQVRTGRLISKIAVTDEGRVVGHLGTRLDRPGDPVAETVGGMVDPEYRRRGLLVELGSAMSKEYSRLELAGIQLFATGAHDLTQRKIVAAGGGVTGVLLGHIPAGTEYRGIEHDFGDARIGCVVFYQPMAAAPRFPVYLPARYRDIVSRIYRDLGLKRDLAAPEDSPSQNMASELSVNPRRGSSVLWVGSRGDLRGLQNSGRTLNEGIEALTAPVAYADVCLAQPGAPQAIEVLRSKGFFMGCVLPGSERSEVLRMQRIQAAEIAPERILVPEGTGRDISRFIAQDRQNTARESG